MGGREGRRGVVLDRVAASLTVSGFLGYRDPGRSWGQEGGFPGDGDPGWLLG